MKHPAGHFSVRYEPSCASGSVVTYSYDRTKTAADTPKKKSLQATAHFGSELASDLARFAAAHGTTLTVKHAQYKTTGPTKDSWNL